ncbi:hypothetical protein O181_001959 [Austropuccinia psidii MF-1]|uniref:Retrovirus-related Pol polyprotein from transposon TNT 1-94 n=1 Tax=Austropuccinia psidii MF-1 TaxID=1389203 RepID=A0A9Q3BBI8_9BASI|nr:hypothetical protein [Austropuccinia psidii MF-1]
MSNCKSVSTPMIPNSRLIPMKENEKSPEFDYRQAIGLLNYLVSCTRPDLAFVTAALSQFLEKPTNGMFLLSKESCDIYKELTIIA